MYVFVCIFPYRRIQLLNGGFDIQTRILLLSSDHLRPLLHAGDRLLGQFLAGPQRRARACQSGGHHATDHVDTNRFYQQFITASCLHQSYRCLDWSKFEFSRGYR